MRRRSALTVLLAALLLLQWGTAFAHCLRLASPPPGLAMEICTPDGLHLVVLPGAPDGKDKAPSSGPACPACLGSAGGFPTLAPAIPPPLQLVQAADPPPPPPPAPTPLPPRSCQPRAPPTS